MSEILRVIICDECDEKGLCEHEVTVDYDDGGKETFLMSAENILENYVEFITVQEKEHLELGKLKNYERFLKNKK